MQFGAIFLSIRKAVCRRSSSGLPSHGVWNWRVLKEGATTDDKRKQRSGSLKAAKLVSVRKQRWAGAIASRRPRRPLVSWCDSAARPRFWRLASWKLKLEILVASKSDVRHWQPFVLVFHCVSVLRGQGFGGLQVGN